MRSLWKLWIDATTEEKALRVARRVEAVLGRTVVDRVVEPYPKTGGFVVGFGVDLESTTWNDLVVEVVGLGQRVGHAWTLTGDVFADPSGWSNDATASGVRSIEWMLILQADTSRPG